MSKQLKLKFILFFLLVFLILPLTGQAVAPAPKDIPQDELVKNIDPNKTLDLYFFYSESCSHCIAEQPFLDKMEKKYSQVNIIRLLHNDPQAIKIQLPLLKKHNAEKYFGLTPLNFIGEVFMPGFDNEDSAGKYMELAILQQLQKNGVDTARSLDSVKINQDKVKIPILGTIDLHKYSLPILAGVLGLLDGFNVCSLGALFMILGLVLVLKSRRKILIYGGTFIFVTAVIYGSLIVLWYKFFIWLAPYMKIFQILIALLALGGAIYFFKRYLKIRKHGPTCEIETGQKITDKFTNKIKNHIEKPNNAFATVGIILIFAAVLTIVEFPCSAVIPVAFASILTQSQLSVFTYLFYIIIFVLFYLLDELIIFLIAVFKMDIWLASDKFTKWSTLIESVILFLIGLYYLI